MNTNEGSLFKNDKKEKPNQPDWKGQANITGKDCWLAAWVKEDKNGKKFFSIAVEDKQKEVTGTSFLMFRADKEHADYESPKEPVEFAGEQFTVVGKNKTVDSEKFKGTICELTFTPLDGLSKTINRYEEGEEDGDVPF